MGLPVRSTPELLDEAGLRGAVDHGLRLPDPEVPDGAKVGHDDGPLVPEAALHNGRPQGFAPLGKDGGVVAAGAAAQEVEVPDKGQGAGDLWDALYSGKVATAFFICTIPANQISKHVAGYVFLLALYNVVARGPYSY
ncbi:hypothetical protein G7054_g14640 [Neopestalotiopsis clavispora]|nr:hypothetical protein G7054_g14640 [Neopestalotiopsis clavispora]